MSASHHYEMPTSALLHGLESAADKFNPPGVSSTLVADSLKIAFDKSDGRNRMKAVLAPAINFVLTATVDVFDYPGVKDEMPSEVYVRQDVMGRVAGRIIDACAQTGLLFDLYWQDIKRRQSLAVSIRDLMGDANQLKEFALAPLFEVGVVAGGASRRLQSWARKQGVELDDPSQAILGSRGLQFTSGIDMEKGGYIRYLGMPYANPGLFEVKVKDDAPEVVFTADARAHIAENFFSASSGCPAARMRPRLVLGAFGLQEPGNTLNALDQSWRETGAVLLHGDYATDFPSFSQQEMAQVLAKRS